ncbi:MAG: MCP four helix bundle domain-containing protein [Saprospiraceae bacterium]|nr:MCP four helix bundle domain-containing protein [Saprospiraceae bacterium]
MDASKWVLNSYSKLKMAFVLVLLALLLFVANIFEKEQMERMDQSFLSIYEDRLVPATSIFEIRENLYRKRELLKEGLQPANTQTAIPRAAIDSCNQGIHQLLTAYKKTYFLENETTVLQNFESDLQAYDRLEQSVLEQISKGNLPQAQQIYERDAVPHFKTAVLKVAELNHIQSEIGKEMLSHSKKSMASFLLLSDLETALIIIFLFIAQILIYASRALSRNRTEPFSVN